MLGVHEGFQLVKEDQLREVCLVAEVELMPEYWGNHQFSCRHVLTFLHHGLNESIGLVEVSEMMWCEQSQMHGQNSGTLHS